MIWIPAHTCNTCNILTTYLHQIPATYLQINQCMYLQVYLGMLLVCVHNVSMVYITFMCAVCASITGCSMPSDCMEVNQDGSVWGNTWSIRGNPTQYFGFITIHLSTGMGLAFQLAWAWTHTCRYCQNILKYNHIHAHTCTCMCLHPVEDWDHAKHKPAFRLRAHIIVNAAQKHCHNKLQCIHAHSVYMHNTCTFSV